MKQIAFIQDLNGNRHLGFDVKNDNVIFTALVEDLGDDIKGYYKYNGHYLTLDNVKIVFDAHCVWFTENECKGLAESAISGVDKIEWCTMNPPKLPPI